MLRSEESHLNLSMSPKHPRYALDVLAASELATPSLPGTLTSSVKGSSTGAGPVADPLTIEPGRKTLRISVDYGLALDVVLFPTETAPVDKTPTQIRNELNAALAARGATVSQTGGVLTIESSNAGLDSAVVVTPAPTGDISGDLQLGRAWGGVEFSGSADRRPATTAAGPIGFKDGKDGTAVVPSDVVPSDNTTGIYALGSLLFPRFNLLCLPGLTSADDVQLSNAIAYCKEERAFLIVDSPGRRVPEPAHEPAEPRRPDRAGRARGDLLPAAPGRRERARRGEEHPRPSCLRRGRGRATRARTPSAASGRRPPAVEAGIVGISGLTEVTDDDLSGVLNPRGINVLRTFPGAGTVVWGARTLKGDDTASSEFKYVPIRRLTNYIASSLYLGTQFAVFEPNDPDLWAQLRLAVGTFMRGLFRQGAFQQSTKRAESDSFFVVCDETTNTQAEIDLGRVNVVVGFAPLKPAEFVVITITQISQLEE